ncbi:MAG TPA: hypothetical protein VMQ44_02555, partial [Candidatus Saccharimonadales bacterium]|nr:hypothetical protein [Candidatus Saccharimonadales bacterium]
GLYVVGTERHESRRIDNQLRGRAARQGDPGETKFFISMEDDLMRIFGGDRMKSIMERLKIPEDMSINNKLLSRAIEQSQTRVEGYNFDTRKQLVEYDDVMNKHREAIYIRRRNALFAQNQEAFKPISEELLLKMTDEERDTYQKKAATWPAEAKSQIERAVILRTIDVLWIEHLTNIESLRESIGLRGYGQRDPIVEYKQEAYNLFGNLNRNIDSQVIQTLLHLEIQPTAPEIVAQPTQMEKLNYSGGDEAAPQPAKVNPSGKVGRNDPCPCGAIDPATGKVYKFKKCGLINAPYHKG